MIEKHHGYLSRKMENKLKITKAKSLVEAAYRLTLDEKRLIHYAIAKVNPLKYFSGQIYRFSALEFARCYGIDENSCYKQAKNALDQLFERKATYYDCEKKTNVTCRLIINKFDDEKGIIGVRFSDEMQKLLTVDRDFLSYAIKHTVKFTSPSAIRIYEILLYSLQRSPTNKLNKRLNIEELKEILGLSDKYKRFSDFKNRVLDVAKENINKYSDIRISYEIIKSGRIPTEIKILVKYKKEFNQEIIKLQNETDILTPKLEKREEVIPSPNAKNILDGIKKEIGYKKLVKT